MKIKTPTLIIDRLKVEANIKKMLDKTGSNTIFRPHFKTHQSAEIGDIFKNFGISKITVSSVSMAKYFAKNGWNDITIAFPVNIRELDDIAELSSTINLNLLIESSDIVNIISQKLVATSGVFIKIDSGYHRTGLTYQDTEIDNILIAISKCDNLVFKGFLTHAGHTYNAKGSDEIIRIMEESSLMLNALKEKYIPQFPEIITSYGDTPSCSIAENFDDFDEIRPGNFVYYDVMQFHLGSCRLDDIAVVVACPVVAKHSSRNEIVIYGGGVHLSKEFISADNDFKLYGYIVKLKDGGWFDPVPGAYVRSLSQEHGIVKLSKDHVENIEVGDLIGVLPVHSCMSANLLIDKSFIIN